MIIEGLVESRRMINDCDLEKIVHWVVESIAYGFTRYK
jgi:hypothetical protein